MNSCKITSAGILGLALSGVVSAQQTTTGLVDPNAGRTERIGQGTTSAQTQTTTSAGIQTPTTQSSFLRASSFIGMPVQGAGSAQLGTISDVLLDPNTFGVQYVVLNPNSTLGLSGMPIIPWSLLQAQGTAGVGATTTGGFSVPFTSARLAGIPSATMTSTGLVLPANSTINQFFASELQQQGVLRPAVGTTPGAIDVSTTNVGVGQGPGAARNPLATGTGNTPRVLGLPTDVRPANTGTTLFNGNPGFFSGTNRSAVGTPMIRGGAVVGGTGAGAVGVTNAGAVGTTNTGAVGATNTGSIGVTNSGAVGSTNAGAVGTTNTGAVGGTNAGAVGGTNTGAVGGAAVGATGAASTGGR